MNAVRAVVALALARRARPLRAILLYTLLGPLGLPLAQAQGAAALQAQHADLRAELASNQFHRPLHVESHQIGDDLKGDVYARIEQAFATVATALQDVDHWCDILMLHLNVKGCKASSSPRGDDDRLSVTVGRKRDQPLLDAYLLEFSYRIVTATRDYLQIVLEAAEGPLGTGRYRILLEVVALDEQRSFLHLAYSSAYGLPARMATQSYLATTGRDKVGFSIVDREADGQPVYQRGLRGMVERNTMRYYLAIEAYLDALATPAPLRLDKRLNDWYASTERYPLQLHELDRNEYLAMKHKEIRRQLRLASPAAAR